MAHLTAAEKSRGIIAASAGNHAQGVAYAARQMGLRAVIVMPQTTPQIKVDAVMSMGAEVVLIGDSYPDAQAHCDMLIAETGMTFVHPFDDPLVIAGQGTVGAEILRHSQDTLNAVFVPVGGGGLIAGIAGYIKSLRPDVKVIGVEPFEADAMYRSLQAGTRVRLDHVGIFADGVAVREVGQRTFRDRAADGGRSGARDERRSVRRHQGHLRRHPLGDGAGRRAGHGRPAQVGGARRRARPDARGGVERRQHELRSPALRGGAGRAWRGARGAAGDHPARASGRVPRAVRAPRAGASSPNSTTG